MPNATPSAIYTGAFAEPVFQSQAVFRSLMDAMARPGSIQSLAAALADPSGTAVAPPQPLGRAAGAVMLTLCDDDTAVWLTPALAKSPVPSWLSFHTGAPVMASKSEARFAFVELGGMIPGFGHFALGTQEYPDRSTTLVIEVEALSGGPSFTATGPGIKGEITVGPAGLPEVFDVLWADNRSLFPRGIDLIFVSGTDILCLPRTTKLDRREA